MRKFILTVICALGLSGCASTIAQIEAVIPSVTVVNAEIQQVQNIASQLCNFIPTVATVAGIIGTFTGTGEAVASATAIANSICAAVLAPIARGKRGGALRPTVRGIPIYGDAAR